MTITTNILPKNVIAMAVYPFIFIRKDHPVDAVLLRHERIHHKQQLELLIIPFYLLYFLEYGIKSLIKWGNAYYDISFEREAYFNEDNPNYLKERKLWTWMKHITTNR